MLFVELQPQGKTHKTARGRCCEAVQEAVEGAVDQCEVVTQWISVRLRVYNMKEMTTRGTIVRIQRQ